MRNVVFASLLTVWGTAIVLNRLLGNVDAGPGGYPAGQNVAFAAGIVMIVLGLSGLLRRRRPSSG